MLRGNLKGVPLSSGSDTWKYYNDLSKGKITKEDWREVEEGIARSFGYCMTMGTASTMTSIAETIGFVLPEGASIPAADSNYIRLAAQTGRRIVEMAWEDLRQSEFLSPSSSENAISAAMAVGCSTNAIIHFIAIARRAGFENKSRRF